MATETHIAGLDMLISDRYMIQRCAWCGAVLLAYDLTRIGVMSKEDGSPGDPPSMFPAGMLVRCTLEEVIERMDDIALGRSMKEVLDDEKLPEDACALTIPFEGVTGV